MIEQTKIIQEEVSPEVSKMNHSVINKKQRNQIQFYTEKMIQSRKRKNDSSLLSNPSYQSIDYVIN